MLWKGRRGSGNVEDRRGMSGGTIAGGVGISGIIIALVVTFLGGDPSIMLDLLAVNLGSSSEQTEISAEEQELAEFVSVVLADTEDVWEKTFQEMGMTYRAPKLVLFSGQVQSACGFASDASGPFYCPGDEKVYIDLSFCQVLEERFGAHGDFAIAYVIAHEVGHHVQNLMGVLSQVQEQQQRMNQTDANAMTVKLELQADFLSGYWAHHADKMFNILEAGDFEEAIRAAGAVGDDAIQMKTQGRVVPDDFTHGTSEQRMSWFRRGFESGDLSQSDTFKRGAV